MSKDPESPALLKLSPLILATGYKQLAFELINYLDIAHH